MHFICNFGEVIPLYSVKERGMSKVGESSWRRRHKSIAGIQLQPEMQR